MPWYLFNIPLKNTTAHEKSTKLKITKMAGCAEELDVVDELDEELKEFFGIKRVFRYNISFIDLPLGVFGEIFPSVMIFPSG